MEVTDYLNARNIPGVRFMARRFRPTEEPHKEQDCDGLDIQLVNRDALDSSRLGLELLDRVFETSQGSSQGMAMWGAPGIAYQVGIGRRQPTTASGED